MVIVGIDPGKTGGIAVLNDDSVEAYPYTPQRLISIIQDLTSRNIVVTAYLEKVHAMPGQGVVAMFTFGTGYGEIIGILEALDVTIEFVPPQTWKRALHVTSEKKTSIVKAQQLFPDTSLLASSRCRVPSDGMAEALLIAEYGRIQEVIKSNKILKE